MTVNKTGASTTPYAKWSEIPWARVTKEVERLQVRIAKAVKAERWNKVKVLQRLLDKSYFARLLAVKRVTENKGGKTPGIDGETWTTSDDKLHAVQELDKRSYRAKPLRRVYIAKKDKSKRPLGIPTLYDRAKQSLLHLGLEPIAETTADKHSYGFRRNRCCMDAIEQCFRIFARKSSAQWVLEGDIKSCFDTISHEWIEQYIPLNSHVLNQWLKCGVVFNNKWRPTKAGVPQGGVCSPTITNMVLDGIEDVLKDTFKQSDKIHIVRYADDFVVSGNSKEILENKVKPLIADFLRARGLHLSPTKTHITHISHGFDFLGYNLRKYSDKLLVKPSKPNIKSLLAKISGIVRKHSDTTISLLRRINPILRGWANYYRHVVAKKTFSYIDHKVFMMILYWCRRRHPNKSIGWIKRRYYASPKSPHLAWSFHATFRKPDGMNRIMELFKLAYIPIQRYIKVRGDANPFLDTQYFENRRYRKIRST